ncbi:hypothetical protein LTR08_001524 [Meristemomyces frigidus]|nr:hypothetical protein LTR08_001524 [Meristemomyces frigidus]
MSLKPFTELAGHDSEVVQGSVPAFNAPTTVAIAPSMPQKPVKSDISTSTTNSEWAAATNSGIMDMVLYTSPIVKHGFGTPLPAALAFDNGVTNQGHYFWTVDQISQDFGRILSAARLFHDPSSYQKPLFNGTITSKPANLGSNPATIISIAAAQIPKAQTFNLTAFGKLPGEMRTNIYEDVLANDDCVIDLTATITGSGVSIIKDDTKMTQNTRSCTSFFTLGSVCKTFRHETQGLFWENVKVNMIVKPTDGWGHEKLLDTSILPIHRVRELVVQHPVNMDSDGIVEMIGSGQMTITMCRKTNKRKVTSVCTPWMDVLDSILVVRATLAALKNQALPTTDGTDYMGWPTVEELLRVASTAYEVGN